MYNLEFLGFSQPNDWSISFSQNNWPDAPTPFLIDLAPSRPRCSHISFPFSLCRRHDLHCVRTTFPLSVSGNNSSADSDLLVVTYMLLLDISAVFYVVNSGSLTAPLLCCGIFFVMAAIMVFPSVDLYFHAGLIYTSWIVLFLDTDGNLDGDIAKSIGFSRWISYSRVGNNSTEVTSLRARKGSLSIPRWSKLSRRVDLSPILSQTKSTPQVNNSFKRIVSWLFTAC